MHVRTQIRDRVATLIASPSLTVYKARVWPVADVALPAAIVFCGDETSSYADLASTVYEHELQLHVEVRHMDADDMDANLNTHAAAVEVAIANDPRLNGLAQMAELTGTTFTNSTAGRAAIGAARLTYLVLYRTATNDPETAL